MREAIHPHPEYAFMAWCLVEKSIGTTLPLPSPSYPHETYSIFYARQRRARDKLW